MVVPDLIRTVLSKLYRSRYAALYAMAFIMIFAMTYQFMGMAKHFDCPEYLKGREQRWTTALYTSFLAQSNAMPDVTPKTTVARMLFMAQVTLGWFWFLLFSI